MKRLYISLNNQKSLEKAIKALEEYEKDLNEKVNVFIRRLADIGVNAALMTLATKGQGDSERDADFSVDFEVSGKKVVGIISLSSEPRVAADGRVYYPHLGWEFGAGNRYNGNVSPHPKAAKFGMGPGTFPGQTHVPTPGFWYYRDENGDAVRSYGTQATMPMYTATLEIIERMNDIAQEVFG